MHIVVGVFFTDKTNIENPDIDGYKVKVKNDEINRVLYIDKDTLKDFTPETITKQDVWKALVKGWTLLDTLRQTYPDIIEGSVSVRGYEKDKNERNTTNYFQGYSSTLEWKKGPFVADCHMTGMTEIDPYSTEFNPDEVKTQFPTRRDLYHY